MDLTAMIAWFPALTTTLLFAALLWLSRKVIATRLTKSVEHEFNRKLESIRAENRKSEEQLRASLRAREAEIDALRSGALVAMSNRQVAFDQRRLEAVDQIWASVLSLARARSLAATLSVMKLDKVGEIAQSDPKVRGLMETIGFGFDSNSIDQISAAKARPFVSPMVWAAFSAMEAVVGYAVLQWQAIKRGLNTKGLLDDEVVTKLIKAALPHYSTFIDEHGSSAFYYAIDALEAQLLSELQRMLSGTDDDKANVDRAAEILRHSSEVSRKTSDASAVI